MAIDNETVVGHLGISPVTISEGDIVHKALGLAPVAVLPSCQKTGIGKQMITYLLDNLVENRDNLVVVLGHANYYPKFGFKISKPYGIKWENEVAEESFMVLELRLGALNEISGTVRFHKAFERF